jgi:tetratricopeptide (TPR) repeat protein
MPETTGRRWHLALLAVLPFIVFSNNYSHDYLLDDGYTLVSNPNIRSLDNIPRYFVDPSTYTSLREQADYRPILQVTQALNYAMGGYDTRWWHFTQIVLHVLVTIGIYFLCRRIIALSGERVPDWIPLIAAAVFAVHPGSSGVVNYLNARSSLLVAVLVLPALLAYMKPSDTGAYAKPAWWTAFFFALALFTKVEAVGALGAFLAFDVWQRRQESGPTLGFGKAILHTFDRRTLIRIAPVLAVTLVYFVIRHFVMAPFDYASARHSPNIGPYEYFLTQLTAWWYYIFRWFLAVPMVADYLAYPVYRSLANPVVIAAALGWIAVAALLAWVWRRAPYVVFLAIAALALLSPTSSIAPLGEMVNEHRPYLPLGILSLALFIPAGRIVGRVPSRVVRNSVLAALGVILVLLASMTYRRNRVFATGANYWQDVLAKAPSSRAYVNYGRTFLGTGDPQRALRYFQQALRLAPNWYIIHLNLAATYSRLGRDDLARPHYDRAIETDRYSGMALTSRGDFRLRNGDYAGAEQDFRAALPINLDRRRNLRGLATAYAGLGDVDRSLEQTEALLRLDPRAAGAINGISRPFYRSADLYPKGVEYYSKLTERLPGTWWMYENLSRLARLAGDTALAREAHSRARELPRFVR